MHHYSEYALIVLLLVGLLVWGLNSYRLGKFRGKQKVLPLVIGAEGRPGAVCRNR